MSSEDSSDFGDEPTREITVLAVGNLIMGDDGIGPAILSRLVADRGDDPRIWFEDGGLGGMRLLDVVRQSPRLLILDAIASHLPPGTVLRIGGDQVPRMLASKLSPHQVGLLDVLTAARLLEDEPDVVEVVGVVPALLGLQVGLSDPVEAAIGEAVERAHEVLDEWLVP